MNIRFCDRCKKEIRGNFCKVRISLHKVEYPYEGCGTSQDLCEGCSDELKKFIEVKK